MKPFDRSDEGTGVDGTPVLGLTSERLQAFTKALWDALCSASGKCASVQGELIGANVALPFEYLRNSMTNYYCRDEPGESISDNRYGELLLFMLDTLIENRNHALDGEDVAFFAEVRGGVEADWLRELRIGELNEQAEDAYPKALSDAQQQVPVHGLRCVA